MRGIETIGGQFSVCKVEDYSGIDLSQPYLFLGKTDRENSLVCLTDFVPENTLEQEDGWKGFCIAGQLDFSLIGILAQLTKLLAECQIGVFVVSTFDTDYVFVKEEDYERALAAMKDAGYSIEVSK
ncbi:MAG: ACT domain-containing protein [Dorea sp.]|nr:ACT domain-containing protein [Dorea sp.]